MALSPAQRAAIFEKFAKEGKLKSMSAPMRPMAPMSPPMNKVPGLPKVPPIAAPENHIQQPPPLISKQVNKNFAGKPKVGKFQKLKKIYGY